MNTRFKRRMKRAACLLLAVMLLYAASAFAGAAGGRNICYAYDSESSSSFWSWCVMVGDGSGTVLVFTEPNDDYDTGDTCILESGATETHYTMECLLSLDMFMLWYIEDVGNDASALSTTVPVLNQSYSVHYIVASPDGASLESESRKVTDIQVLDDVPGMALLELNRSVEATDYPGFLVNGKDECVGILFSDSAALLFWYEETEEPEEEEPEEEPEEPEEEPEEPEEEEPEEEPEEPEEEPEKEPDSDSDLMSLPSPNPTILERIRKNMALIIIGIVAAGGIVFGLLVMKQNMDIKKKTRAEPAAPVYPTGSFPTPNPNQPPSGTYPNPNQNPNPNPFNPYSDSKPDVTIPVQIPSNLYLSCRGGYYDGRQIPVQSSVITMGRDPGSTIPFPEDYPAVSRRHAVLRVENGIMTLQDTSSTGTFLKRMQGRIPANQQIQVVVGDVFYLGEQKNRFEIIRL